MKNVIQRKKKHGGKRPGAGRPDKGGPERARALRMSDEQVAQVEAWAKSQVDKPGFSESVRRLVAKGISADER
jgi:hypothetical protein